MSAVSIPQSSQPKVNSQLAIIHGISTGVKGLSALAALGSYAGAIPFLPPSVAPWIGIFFMGVSGLKDFLVAIQSHLGS
jgi:hypothetical protein